MSLIPFTFLNNAVGNAIEAGSAKNPAGFLAKVKGFFSKMKPETEEINADFADTEQENLGLYIIIGVVIFAALGFSYLTLKK